MTLRARQPVLSAAPAPHETEKWRIDTKRAFEEEKELTNIFDSDQTNALITSSIDSSSKSNTSLKRPS
jgi:hypothetical protein